MTVTIAQNKQEFIAQLNATLKATDALSASVVAAVRNVLEQNGNPMSMGFILAGLNDTNYQTKSPKNFATIMKFINGFVGFVYVKEDDGETKRLTEQGDYILKKSNKRLAKIFEAHKITGFKDDISGAELAPLIEQLKTKLDEFLDTRVIDENDEDAIPSIFAAAKDERTDEEKAADKKKKEEEKKRRDVKQWNDGGKEKHAEKIKDMGESFMNCIELVLKTYGHTKTELIEFLTAQDAN